MEQTNINQTSTKVEETRAKTIGQTTYHFCADASVKKVVINGKEFPVTYDVSDVVEKVVSYPLGVEEKKLTGILVAVGEEWKCTISPTAKATAIVKSINDSIEQAVKKNVLRMIWDKPTADDIDLMIGLVSGFIRK